MPPSSGQAPARTILCVLSKASDAVPALGTPWDKGTEPGLALVTGWLPPLGTALWTARTWLPAQDSCSQNINELPGIFRDRSQEYPGHASLLQLLFLVRLFLTNITKVVPSFLQC